MKYLKIVETMFKKISIGIDPGSSSGGITIIYETNLGTIYFESFQLANLTELDIVNKLEAAKLKSITGNISCVLEEVHAFPIKKKSFNQSGEEVEGMAQGIVSTFKFGQNYGFLRGILTALRISFDDVSPQKWIKSYGMKKDKEESKIEWKRRLRQKAEQIYPNHKIVNNTADSVLIAQYCKDNY
jgi:hypothetical protein